MSENPKCCLCGLEATHLPHNRNKDLVGLSCKRCGDYYIDGLLFGCDEPTETKNKNVLSAFKRWEKEKGHVPPELDDGKIDEIVNENSTYTDEEKVDCLLLYCSIKFPNKGRTAKYNFELDYPITFSPNSKYRKFVFGPAPNPSPFSVIPTHRHPEMRASHPKRQSQRIKKRKKSPGTIKLLTLR